MLSRILWILVLAAPVAASVQYMTTGPNGQLAPAGSTVVVVGNSTGPVLTTPSASFATPQTTAGISLADRAGASPSAPPGTSLPGAAEASAGYSNAGSGFQTGAPPTGESTAAAAANAANTGRLIEDMGPSTYAGAGYVQGGSMSDGTQVAGTTKTSLGEIAAIYKSNRAQNIRTYTNADAERLNAKTTTGTAPGAAGASASATAMPAPQVQPPPTPSTSPTQPQLSANLRPSPSIRANMAQSDAGTSAQGSAATQSNTTPPAPQQAGHSQQNDQESGRSLPASSTLLPLFGLLGLASGGLGIWLTKFRK